MDEASFSSNLCNPLSFTSRSRSKCIMISSVNTNSEKTCKLLSLQDSGCPFYHVTFCCKKDVAKLQNNSYHISCPHYLLAIPPWNSSNIVQRNVMNRLQENSFYSENLGIKLNTQEGDKIHGNTCIFTDQSIEHVTDMTNTLNTTLHRDLLDTTLYVYLDPGYCPSEQSSNTGIAIWSLLKTNRNIGASKNITKGVLLGIDEYSLPVQTGNAPEHMGLVLGNLLLNVICVHCDPKTSESHFKNAVICIESNSNKDCVRTIAKTLNKLSSVQYLLKKIVLWYVHEKVKSYKMSELGCASVRSIGSTDLVGFFLTGEKKTFINQFRNDLYHGRVVISQALVSSFSVHLSCMLQKIREQLNNLRMSGKADKTWRDDMGIALVLAYGIMVNRQNEQFVINIRQLTPDCLASIPFIVKRFCASM